MKILNAVAAIIGIIALIGDIFFMYVLVLLGDAFSVLGQLGADADLAEVSKTLGLALNLGWVWGILVLIACLFVLKFSLIDARKKAK